MFGIDDAINIGLKVLDRVIPDPIAKTEAQQKLLELQQTGQIKLEEFDVKREEIAANDRNSARIREASVKDQVPRNLAYAVTALYAIIQLSLIFTPVPMENRELLMRALGVLDACLIGVWGYYFGSTANSRNKDITIQSMANK